MAPQIHLASLGLLNSGMADGLGLGLELEYESLQMLPIHEEGAELTRVDLSNRLAG